MSELKKVIGKSFKAKFSEKFERAKVDFKKKVYETKKVSKKFKKKFVSQFSDPKYYKSVGNDARSVFRR